MTSNYCVNPCYSKVTKYTHFDHQYPHKKWLSHPSKPTYFPNHPKNCFDTVLKKSSTNHGYVTTMANILNHTRACSSNQNKLKIAVVGFGNFGQFLAKEMVKQGHQVLAYSRSDYSSKVSKEIGVQFFKNADDLCEEHPEVVLLCTSILSTEKVLLSLPVYRLRRSTLFVDALSVKEFPRTLFLQHLPKEFDILCTHPMFGPDSGKFGWSGLPFVYDKVRVDSNPIRSTRIHTFLDIFQKAGCRMVEMTCAEHDKHAAGSQFITHMMGRVLEKVGLTNTPINTKGYESLLNLVDNTTRDNFELFYGLFLYNKNAMEQLDKLDWAFEMVKDQLTCHLHEFVGKQLMLESRNEVNNNHNHKLMIPAAANHDKNICVLAGFKHDVFGQWY